MAGWREHVRKVTPYVPGEQPHMEGMVKLNTNENPYPPSPGVCRRLREMEEETEEFRLYPDTQASPIVEALAERFNVSSEQIFVGVGSDDVLATAFLTFFNGQQPVLFPDITYSFYDVWANLYRIPYQKIPLDEKFRIRLEDYQKWHSCVTDGENKDSKGVPPQGIVIANPNAPTGIYEPVEFIEHIVSHNPNAVVIVDEAYVDFVMPDRMHPAFSASMIPLTARYENLLVVQTFSKSRSLAGMRIGYAVGNPELIAAMNAVKFSCNSYTMNLPAQLLGAESVKDEAYFEETVKRIVTTREHTKIRLEELGFRFPDSSANFLFVTHPKKQAEYLFSELRKRRIFVRHFTGERIHNYLRITIGTEKQMEQLFTALKEI